MTAQIAERLNYKGEVVAMCTNPLDDYFAMGGSRPRFEFNCTALWRGYVGSWEIVDYRLYLMGLNGTLRTELMRPWQPSSQIFPTECLLTGTPERFAFRRVSNSSTCTWGTEARMSATCSWMSRGALSWPRGCVATGSQNLAPPQRATKSLP